MVGQWVWAPSRKPTRSAPIGAPEKREIVAACEGFIATVLKPRFLPEIQPSDRWNYPIDICGDWRAGRYRFIQRYRVGGGPNAGQEFDAPFARIDRLARNAFALNWMRHNGQWIPFEADAMPLAEALKLIETVEIFNPH